MLMGNGDPQKGPKTKIMIDPLFLKWKTFDTTYTPDIPPEHGYMDGWNTSFLLVWPILRGFVSFRECTI